MMVIWDVGEGEAENNTERKRGEKIFNRTLPCRRLSVVGLGWSGFRGVPEFQSATG